MKNHLVNYWQRIRFAVFAVLLTSSLLYLRYGEQAQQQQWALWGNDLMQQLSPRVAATDVVLVEITDADTATQGAWPWSRAELGRLVNRLRDAGAGVIVFADVFDSVDLAKTDAQFADSVRDNGVVVARSVTEEQVLNPVDVIQNSAAAVGVSNFVADADRRVRRMDLVTINQDRVYASLAVETVRTMIGSQRAGVQQQDHAHSIKLQGIEPWIVPTNSRWRIKFHNEFERLNALSTDFSAVKNKVVVIGVAAAQVNNWSQTPVGARRNHEIQAHFIQSLFDRNNVITPQWADLLEMLISALILTSILKAAKANTPYACVPVYAGGVAVVILGSWTLFNTANLAVDWTWPVLSSTSVFALTFYYHWARKRQREWSISRRFGGLVSAQVLRRLKAQPQLNTTGELKEITVMYADLRGFAQLAANYGSDAEGLVQTVHKYMDQVLPAVTQNLGTVDKLIGDGVVAFWNAPLDVEYHALKAVRSAIAMQRAVAQFNSEQHVQIPLCLDIGVNTGIAAVGNTGSRKTFNYTAIGETVRTADNFENLCKHYGVNILLGEQTEQQIMRAQSAGTVPQFDTIELDTVTTESGACTKVFTVLWDDQMMSDNQRASHKKMLEHYHAGQWDQAIRRCKELKTEPILTAYYDTMLKKCKAAKAQQQEDSAA
jgi:adenylate cyclase